MATPRSTPSSAEAMRRSASRSSTLRSPSCAQVPSASRSSCLLFRSRSFPNVGDNFSRVYIVLARRRARARLCERKIGETLPPHARDRRQDAVQGAQKGRATKASSAEGGPVEFIGRGHLKHRRAGTLAPHRPRRKHMRAPPPPPASAPAYARPPAPSHALACSRARARLCCAASLGRRPQRPATSAC